MNEEQNKLGRTVVGKVLSNKMDKTIVVSVERKVPHPLYGKYVRKFSKICAHDKDNVCKIGDVVEIEMCRPLSKTKSWMLVKVLTEA
ncbi:MAG TPA: 30S ribosomal protein S17 [Gammaproteobacteria bacterium]|nr:30S ribosomal protein S17 [Gammaproteobacteria bacterium]